MTQALHWRQRVGNQRDWVWRGWQTRYTYIRAANGEGQPPLILLHGFGTSIGHWRHNLQALSQRHTVYALDLLGFGASEKAAAPYDVAFWAEQVYDFWRQFVGQPVVLVGNSIGSLVCLAIAATHPEMVQGIVMINLPDSSVLESPVWVKQAIATAAFCLTPVTWMAKTILTSPVVFNPAFRLIRSSWFLKFWAKQAYTNPAAMTEELLEILASPAFDRGAAAALRAMVTSRSKSGKALNAKTILPHLDMPLLLLWGKQDMMVPPKLAPLFARYNPQIQFVEIDNAGHCPHDERPEFVNQLILDWLSRQA